MSESPENTGGPRARVLDENVGLLLRRAYVPVLPSPEFRARLERTWLAEVRRRSAARPPAGRRLAFPIGALAGLAAAAAVLVLAWMATRPATGPRDAASWIEQGRVAVRAGDGAWRAATERELAAGIALGDQPLAIVTPREQPLDVHAAEGRVSVAGDSSTELWARAGAVGGRLEHGRLDVERELAGTGAPWTLRTDPGSLVLERGAVELERSGDLERFLLVAGRADYVGPAGRIPLAPGEELRVVAGAVEPEVAAVVAEPEPEIGIDGEERRAVAAETAAPAEPPARPGLRGIVRDPDGAPVRRFRVGWLRERAGNPIHSPERRDFEDEDGEFRWDDLEPGRGRVFVHAEGFALASVGERTVGEGAPALDVGLVRGGTVRGHVVDATTGNPVADALVLSERDAPQAGLLFADADRHQWLPAATRTLADGSFELAHLSPGAHTLRVTAPGHAPLWTEPLEVRDGATIDGVLWSLRAGGALEGRVARDDGSPWPGAMLVVLPMDQGGRAPTSVAQARADDLGRFRFDDLPPVLMLAVLVDVEVAARPTVKPVEIRAGATARVDFGGDTSGARLAGRVVDANGRPLAFTNLGLFQQDTAARFAENFNATATLADGSFVFHGLEPGTYILYVVLGRGDRIRLVDSVDVPAWGMTDHEVRVLDLRVTGQVLDGRNGEPLPGCEVALYQRDPRDASGGTVLFAGNARTDEDGRYELGSLNPGRYWLTAYPAREGLGFESAPAFELGEEGARIDLALQAGGSVEVDVIDPAGAPLAYATVEFRYQDGSVHTLDKLPTTDERGRYATAGLRPGRYEAVASAGGHAIGTAPFVCRIDERASVRVVLSPTPNGDEENDLDEAKER